MLVVTESSSLISKFANSTNSNRRSGDQSDTWVDTRNCYLSISLLQPPASIFSLFLLLCLSNAYSSVLLPLCTLKRLFTSSLMLWSAWLGMPILHSAIQFSTAPFFDFLYFLFFICFLFFYYWNQKSSLWFLLLYDSIPSKLLISL